MNPFEPVVKHADEVPAEPVSEEMATGTTIQWLVGKWAPTFAMRRFKLLPGAHIRKHRHPWEHEIYVLDGSGRVAIDGRVYEVERMLSSTYPRVAGTSTGLVIRVWLYFV